MGRMLNIVTPLHKMTKRDYVGRMMDEKVHCMMKAKEYEKDYWDGDRRYGYGGYRYIEGRWAPVAQGLIEEKIRPQRTAVVSSTLVLAKAILLREFKLLLPQADARRLRRLAVTASPTLKPDVTRPPVPLPGAGPLPVRRPSRSTSWSRWPPCTTCKPLRAAGRARRRSSASARRKYVILESYRNELEQFNHRNAGR